MDEANEPTKILTLDEILSAKDLPEKTVYIAQWGGNVVVRALTRGELKDAYRKATDRKGETDADQVEEYILCWGSVSPKLTPPTYKKLAEHNAGAVRTMLDAILGLSGADDQALERARDSFRDPA